jgi:hypothetical protein
MLITPIVRRRGIACFFKESKKTNSKETTRAKTKSDSKSKSATTGLSFYRFRSKSTRTAKCL